MSLVRETANWSELIVFSTGTGMTSWAAVAAYFNFYGQRDLASTIALVAGPPHAAAPHTVHTERATSMIITKLRQEETNQSLFLCQVKVWVNRKIRWSRDLNINIWPAKIFAARSKYCPG